MMLQAENKPGAAWLAHKAYELRRLAMEMAIRAGGGHLGGAFSVMDIITALYFRVLNHDPKNPDWPGRAFCRAGGNGRKVRPSPVVREVQVYPVRPGRRREIVEETRLFP